MFCFPGYLGTFFCLELSGASVGQPGFLRHLPSDRGGLLPPFSHPRSRSQSGFRGRPGRVKNPCLAPSFFPPRSFLADFFAGDSEWSCDWYRGNFRSAEVQFLLFRRGMPLYGWGLTMARPVARPNCLFFPVVPPHPQCSPKGTRLLLAFFFLRLYLLNFRSATFFAPLAVATGFAPTLTEA